MNRKKPPEITWQHLKKEFGMEFLVQLLTRKTIHEITILDNEALKHNQYWRHWCYQKVLEINKEFQPPDIYISQLQ